jgi:hypothetical protein
MSQRSELSTGSIGVDPELATVADETWWSLTSDRDKVRHYATESAFRHGWAAFHDGLRDEIEPTLHRMAMAIVLPEGLAGRRAEQTLAFLRSAAFTPVLARPVQLGPAAFREMWRYASNVHSYDAMVLNELAGGKSTSVLLVLRDDQPSPLVPASVRLTALKGPARPAKRHAGQLRSALGAPNPTLVMVHCSDEPIDVVRELAIAVEYSDLGGVVAQLRAAMSSDPADAAAAHLLASQREVPPHQMDVEAAIKAVRSQIDQARTDPAAKAAADRAESALLAALDGTCLSWRTWSRDLLALGIDVMSWDVLIVASTYVDHKLVGATSLIAGKDADAWHPVAGPNGSRRFSARPPVSAAHSQ